MPPADWATVAAVVTAAVREAGLVAVATALLERSSSLPGRALEDV